MKKHISLALAVLLGAFSTLTACSNNSSDTSASTVAASEENTSKANTNDSTKTGSTSSYKFAFSASELSNPWVAMVKDGFEAACKDSNVEFVTLNAGSDIDKQVSDMESVIGGGYNAIIFNPIDGNALETVLNSATSKDIASVTIAQIANAATAGIELDDTAYGTVIGNNAVEWINANLGGKGKVAVLSEDNIESSIKRGDAIVAAIEAGCPDVEIVARQQAHTPELGLKTTESILLQHPDLNVVVCANDSSGIGAYQAMQNAGISGDQYGIFSGDMTDEVMGYIREPGSIYRGTADLHPYESGYEAVKMALDYLENGMPTEHVSVPLQMEAITQADVLAGKYD